ncbi:hypothetical protein QOZ80_1AG0021880 [Eleusine coracana subsp. coracana]|nr:hypothetical protein QOZ80_1AG0021880 [Eleusine coracana subsp. coracana]
MAPRSWSDGLHIDLLVLIFLNLHCIADRASFALVCQSWKRAKLLAETGPFANPPPRQIPWLLYPSRSHGRGPSITSFLSRPSRRIRSLDDDISRGRLCGSYPGGWVAAVLTPWGHQVLFNVFSRARINLPHRMRFVASWFSAVTPVDIRMVVLSSAPNSTGGHSCFAGAIVRGTANVAFCRPGVDEYWSACLHIDEGLLDMVYFDGEDQMRGFHVLTEGGHVVAFTTDNNVGTLGTTFVPRYRYNSLTRLLPDTMLPYLPSSATPVSITRYLVVSRQRLLMVARYFSQRSCGTSRTLLFRVFQMRVVLVEPQGRGRMVSWVELDGLDGRVLFIGRGCSRAYEASELPGFNEGRIYFIDDAKTDPPVASEDGPSSDIGMYSMSSAVVRPTMDSTVYGTKTSLCWTRTMSTATNDQAKTVLKEMTEAEVKASGSKIASIRWNFPTEPLSSKLSPPIWVAP